MERLKIDRLLQRERRCARFEPQYTSCGRSINRIAAGAVDSGGSSRERIEQAKLDWAEGRFAKVPGETEFIPLPER